MASTVEVIFKLTDKSSQPLSDMEKKYAQWSKVVTEQTAAYNAVQKQKATALAAAAQAQKAAQKAEEDAIKTQQKHKLSLTDLNSAIQLGKQGIEQLKKAYNFSREGAQIEFLQSKFDNLSASIGTTSSALMTDLKSATRGTLSDMELMASVTDLVGLGLANSHDEAVRLATVSAGLGMNMNQLVLTLTNMTTMRFDALGVRVDGFKEKVKALEEQGYSTDEAFREAFLQQAEAQLKTVGNAADSTLGSFMRLESQIKNIGDSSKQLAAQGLGPLVDILADNLEQSAKFRTTLQEINPELYRQFQTTQIVTDEMEGLVNEYQRAQQYGLAWGAALKDSTVSLEENTAAAELNAEQLKAISDENKKFISTLENVAGNLDDYNEGVAKTKEQFEDGEFVTKLYKERHAELLKTYKDGKITAKEYDATVKDLQNSFADGSFAVNEQQKAVEALAGEYEEASKRIVASLLEMKYMADGTFSDAEMVQYLLGLEKLGLITEADRQATIALYEEATNLHTELGKTSTQADTYSTKMERLEGRTEDAVAGFMDLNNGMRNTADTFAEAAGPISDVTMTLGDLPKSGTMWSYYVHTTYTEDGKAPRLPAGGGQHEQITPGGGGYAAGGPLKHDLAIVGDAPGGGWTPYTEVIVNGRYVLDAKTARRMKDAGLLDGAMALAGGGSVGGRSPSTGGSRAGGGGGTGGRTPNRSEDSAPRSGLSLGDIAASNTAASNQDIAEQVAASTIPSLEEAISSTMGNLTASNMQQAAIAAQGNELMRQMLERFDMLIVKTASEGGIARSVFEGQSKLT